MKHLIPLVLLLLALVLGTMTLLQRTQLRAQQATISQLNQQLQARNILTAENRETALRLKSENKAFIEESHSLREKLAMLSASPAPAQEVPTTAPVATDKKSANPFKGMMEKMKSDPKMRSAVASMQIAALKPLYADLLKQLQLSPDDSTAFFKILTEQTEKAMEAGMNYLSGEKLPENVKDTFGDTQDEMKKLLGDAGYPKYEAYQKTLVDRTALSQISTQMAARQTPLRADQSVGLLQIMQQEKLNTTKFTKARNEINQPGVLPEEAVLNDTLQAQEDRNARILARSQTLLTPDQWMALGEQQNQTLQMQKMGIEMARGMFEKEEK